MAPKDLYLSEHVGYVRSMLILVNTSTQNNCFAGMPKGEFTLPFVSCICTILPPLLKWFQKHRTVFLFSLSLKSKVVESATFHATATGE